MAQKKKRQRPRNRQIINVTTVGSDIDQEALEKRREIYFTSTVDDSSQHHLTRLLRHLVARSKKPITIYMNTAGGSVVDGLAIYDLIRELGKKVPINIIGTGACMSMGAIIMQAATKRSATPNCAFMLHELHAGVVGSLSQMKDLHQQFDKTQKVLNAILRERTGLTNKRIREITERKDSFFSAEEALKFNLIDGIVWPE